MPGINGLLLDLQERGEVELIVDRGLKRLIMRRQPFVRIHSWGLNEFRPPVAMVMDAHELARYLDYVYEQGQYLFPDETGDRGAYLLLLAHLKSVLTATPRPLMVHIQLRGLYVNFGRKWELSSSSDNVKAVRAAHEGQ
ncbi:hypothetical protein Kisp01_27920 [Kineosporia sp. NBRC 101677]|uniref:hypothetical protein n=1 Tax=Kineosporia sp. NBRC 101677 TaxID=3032197 RepID=UPI0024A43492|nr:hypothetical protein [Kineosporia sp. NBRC 101677]GLY15777.1 hypothetical protein Kisp01_27920 [Kineosporia sp. NBRC 101677]